MKSSKGMSLIEMILTMVIVSLALVASLRSFSLFAGRSADVLVQTRTLDLAQLYFDEILSHRFDEDSGVYGVPTYTGPCRITDDGESRENYDDVDDFNAIINEAPSLIDASLAADYAGFLVSVTVTCDDSMGTLANGGKRIDIAISNPLNTTSVFTVFKGNY